jgi:Domain of unknown function (DUF5916)/Carbohydrate family 9 binding domain-like
MRAREKRTVPILVGFACLVVVSEAMAENLAADRPSVRVGRLHRAPTLEEFLSMAPPADLAGELLHVSGFYQREPEDGAPASQDTDVYLGHDDTRLYVVFVAFDDEPARVRARMTRRESVFPDDTVEIQIDSFNDQRRAFSFLTNPYGIQWDAIWTEGQEFDEAWDTVWDSRGRLTDRGYVVWMAIPFASLRFPPAPPDEERTWRVILVRDITRNGETSFWPRVSSRIEGRLNQAATMSGFAGIERASNLWLIPYAAARGARVDPASGPTEDRDDLDVGGDLKWVFRDSMALDATVNPDFSQVEADVPQVTVNQRFEVFFPEKRPFFLENADDFQTPLDLLFTRRIAEPSGGVRVTGKTGPYSLGVLAIDDELPGDLAPEGDPLHGERAWNGVARVRRDVSRQSNVGLFLTDRELGDGHNRVASVDARIKLNDNWETKLQGALSETRDATLAAERDDTAWSFEFNRQGRKANAHLHYLDIGREFHTDLGFVPRVDVRDTHGHFGYRFRPEGPSLVAWGPDIAAVRVEDHDGTRLDEFVEPGFAWELRRETTFAIGARVGHERLRPEDQPALVTDRDYTVAVYEVAVESDAFAALGVEARIQTGRTINYDPAVGAEPEPTHIDAGELELSFRPIDRLRVDAIALETHLADDASGARILRDRVVSLRAYGQINRRLSLRAIVERVRTEVDPAWTSTEARKRIGGDLLLTYLVNPWTALYAGYGTGTIDDPLNQRGEASLAFLKLSYLLRP